MRDTTRLTVRVPCAGGNENNERLRADIAHMLRFVDKTRKTVKKLSKKVTGNFEKKWTHLVLN